MKSLWVVCYLFLSTVLQWLLSSKRRYGRLVGSVLAVALIGSLSWIECRSTAPVNHYDLLNVSPRATRAEIQSNFRRLSLRLHPDRNASPHANAAFLRLTQANDVLMNSRNFYDRFGDLTQPAREDQRWSVVETTLTVVPRYLGWFFVGWLYTGTTDVAGPRQIYFCILVAVLAGEMLVRHGPDDETLISTVPPFEVVRWMRSVLAVSLHSVNALQAILVEMPPSGGERGGPPWSAFHPQVRRVLLQRMLFELLGLRVGLLNGLRANKRAPGEQNEHAPTHDDALPSCQYEPQTAPPDVHCSNLHSSPPGGDPISQSDSYRRVSDIGDGVHGRGGRDAVNMIAGETTPLRPAGSLRRRYAEGVDSPLRENAPLHRHDGDTDCGPVSPLFSPTSPPPSSPTITPARRKQKSSVRRRLRDAEGAVQRMDALLLEVSSAMAGFQDLLPLVVSGIADYKVTFQDVQRIRYYARNQFDRQSKSPGLLRYLSSPFVILLIWHYGNRFILSNLLS